MSKKTIKKTIKKTPKDKIQDLQKKEQRSCDVAVCIPGKLFSNKWVAGWTNFIIQAIQDEINVSIFNQYNPNLYYVRNACLGGNNLKGKNQKPLQGIDYKHILWMDSDNIPSYPALKRLISHDKDIVGGIYHMEDNRYYATVQDFDWDFYKNNRSQFQFLSNDVVKKFREDLGVKASAEDYLLEVKYTGTGFLLLKKGVLEKIGYPWFKPTSFAVPGTDVVDFMGDDVSLCMDAVEKGFKVYVDLGVEIGHEKSYVI